MSAKEIKIPAGDVTLTGDLSLPADAKGIVIFSHGSGSSRHSSRNKLVARELEKKGLTTLLFDLLTEEEDLVYANRFNIELLTERLTLTTLWMQDEIAEELPIGYFGASTGAASALWSAS